MVLIIRWDLNLLSEKYRLNEPRRSEGHEGRRKKKEEEGRNFMLGKQDEFAGKCEYGFCNYLC
jgi:hypothetical protein